VRSAWSTERKPPPSHLVRASTAATRGSCRQNALVLANLSDWQTVTAGAVLQMVDDDGWIVDHTVARPWAETGASARSAQPRSRGPGRPAASLVLLRLMYPHGLRASETDGWAAILQAEVRSTLPRGQHRRAALLCVKSRLRVARLAGASPDEPSFRHSSGRPRFAHWGPGLQRCKAATASAARPPDDSRETLTLGA
jgi:hypothetical protein